MALAEKYHLPLEDLSFAEARFERQIIEYDEPDLLQQVLQRESTLVMSMVEGRALADAGGLALVPGPSSTLPEGGEYIYLGRAAQHDYVVALLPQQLAPAHHELLDLRTAFTQLRPEHQHLMLIAQAITNWRRSYNFCPECGSPVRPTTAGWVLKCVKNGHELFPRTDPAVIVAIIDDQDRILLGANARWNTAVYSVLAGFVEAGESCESAVRREVFEESGVRVDECHYRGSQPWPLPRSLMLGYTAHAQTTDLVPDGLEILDLRWFSRAELGRELAAGSIQIPRGVSIAHALIRDWYGQPLPEAGAR